jgi:hypothetical protein
MARPCNNPHTRNVTVGPCHKPVRTKTMIRLICCPAILRRRRSRDRTHILETK